MAERIPCAHNFVRDEDEGDTVCDRCGFILRSRRIIVHEYRESLPRAHVTYVPTEFVTGKMVELAGMEPFDWPSPDRLKGELSACDKWTDVYKLLSRRSLEKRVLQVPEWMGYPPWNPAWVTRAIYKTCYDGYKLRMLYVMYKLTDLYLPSRASHLPLRSTRATLRKSDAVWQQVCWDFGLPFRPTPFPLRTPWSA